VLRDSVAKTGDCMGAYLPVECGHEALLMGVFIKYEDGQALVQSFLGVESDPAEALAREDVCDGLKEMVNIIVGLVKREMPEYKPLVTSGLPLSLNGFIELGPRQESLCAVVKWGGRTVYFCLVEDTASTFQIEWEHVGRVDPRMSIQEWLGETVHAALSFAEKTLGIEEYRIQSRNVGLRNSDVMAVYMPVVSKEDAALIGLLTDKRGAEELARIFLKLPPAETLELLEVADVLKEILNILSGILKQKLFGQNPILRRGLPVFYDGVIELVKEQEAAWAKVELGWVQVHITVIRKRGSEG
jgi:hypothetical protein